MQNEYKLSSFDLAKNTFLESQLSVRKRPKFINVLDDIELLDNSVIGEEEVENWFIIIKDCILGSNEIDLLDKLEKLSRITNKKKVLYSDSIITNGIAEYFANRLTGQTPITILVLSIIRNLCISQEKYSEAFHTYSVECKLIDILHKSRVSNEFYYLTIETLSSMVYISVSINKEVQNNLRINVLLDRAFGSKNDSKLIKYILKIMCIFAKNIAITEEEFENLFDSSLSILTSVVDETNNLFIEFLFHMSFHFWFGYILMQNEPILSFLKLQLTSTSTVVLKMVLGIFYNSFHGSITPSDVPFIFSFCIKNLNTKDSELFEFTKDIIIDIIINNSHFEPFEIEIIKNMILICINKIEKGRYIDKISGFDLLSFIIIEWFDSIPFALNNGLINSLIIILDINDENSRVICLELLRFLLEKDSTISYASSIVNMLRETDIISILNDITEETDPKTQVLIQSIYPFL